MEVSLRGYQQEAVDAVVKYLLKKKGNPLVALPTGSGKSHVQAGLIKTLLDRWPNTTVMCLTHVKELIQQNSEKMQMYMPGVGIGVYSAGLNRRELGYPITFAGIQSIYNKDIAPPSLIIIDECHLVPKSGQGMYRQFLERMLEAHPGLRVIGLTATPYRMRGGMLTGGKGKMFDSIVYNLSIDRLIKEGVLAPVKSAATSTEIDTHFVGIQAGEFNLKELSSAADEEHVTGAAIKDAFKHGHNRRSWLFFCVSVAHTNHVADALRRAGVTAAPITGETLPEDRAKWIADYKKGDIKALVNCNVLTTGFDAPETDMIVLLRPTVSPGLYVQMVGRGMRPAEGKDDCLVLDYGGNISRHGPIDDVVMPMEPKGKGEAPVKYCPICLAECHLSLRMCEECGHEFQMEEKELGKKASKLALLKSQRAVKKHAVTSVSYSAHKSKSGYMTLCVEYWDGVMSVAKEYVCIEHRGFARHKAEKWWLRRDKYIDDVVDVPEAVADALSFVQDLLEPQEVHTRFDGKYDEVVGYLF
jgi:DNA repair protein RadD